MSASNPRKITGLALVLLSFLVLTFFLWDQGRELERNRALATSSSSQLTRPDLPHRPLASSPLIGTLAGLLLLSGCALLALNQDVAMPGNLGLEELEKNVAQPQGPQGFDLDHVSKLLAQQRSISRAERVAVATEFAAAMSHEIRNPLAGVQMSLSNIIAESSDNELRDRLQLIFSETTRVADLLSRALGAARQTPEAFEDIAIADLVEDLLEILRFQMPETLSIERKIEGNPEVTIPPGRFRHCLVNLLLNSIQAVDPEEGQIHLQISAREADLRLTVSDNGPGFPEVFLAGGPRPFGDRKAAGGGIGLAMVRRFVREMGGEIQLTNEKRSDGSSGGKVTILLSSVVHHG